jgi:hypothetical protein
MLNKLSSILVAVGMFSVLLFSGCGQSADLSLKFSPDGATAYKATTEVTKLFRFEQPNLGKLKEEETKTLVEMGFTQTIQAVDADGNATAQITINDLKVDIVNKNESRLSFDSQNEKDQNAPLAKLLGKSYTIEISPAGRVKPLDTKDAMAAVTSAYEKKIVKGLFDSDSIANRHQIAALPKEAADELSVEDTWSEIVASPPGLLAPKSYEKTYTLATVDGDVATIQMTAGESAETVEGSSPAAGGMGMFAKMFDNEDDYTGTLQFDLATGEVILSAETLISTYTAQEMPENGDPDKGPDVLTMQFINRIQLEKLN